MTTPADPSLTARTPTLLIATTPAVRAGLIVFGLLSIADIVTLFVIDGAYPPYGIAVTSFALGVLSLGLVVPAWRGSNRALRLLVGLRIISALLAAPAFFGGVPVPAVVAAASIVVLTIIGVLLVASLTSGRDSR